MSDALIGYGGKVYVESADSPFGSPPEYNELAEITNITPPNFEVDDVDVTHMQSPNRTREFISGLIDPGEASFEMNWIPGSATDILLINLKTEGTVANWKMEWSNGTYWEFVGYVKGYEPSAETEDKMSATCTIRVSGDITTSYSL